MKARRALSLPPYLFEDLEKRCRKAVASGRDVIDLSIGDPDLAPPESLLAHLREALSRDRHHRYPPQRGAAELKTAIQGYLSRRCGVTPALDEILVLIGSKEGLGHLPLAVCDSGDLVMVPDPGYPVYRAAAHLAGARVRSFDLDTSTGYAPAWKSLSESDLRSARLVTLNYPNNPTGATVTPDTLMAAVDLARTYQTVVVNDAAYAEVYSGNEAPPLLCAQTGALEAPVIEFFSFSKTLCVTGWRVGFAVGREDVIDALACVKANLDSGVFGAIQEAVARTLDTDGDIHAAAMRREFGLRRERAAGALEKLGFECSPGAGFGERGEGFFRIALTKPLGRIEEAVDRIGRL
jgi:LL-diaminopimelate aminotransferase